MIKTKVPSLLTIAVLTLITSVFWVVFSVYQIFHSKAILDIPPKVLEPISPVLDSQQIDKIAARVFFEESQIPESPAVASSPGKLTE